MNLDENEIDKFNQNAEKWWDVEGELRTLHHINPARLDFISDFTELAGKKVLDVGCGGGILSESMAKAKANVLGIDLAEAALKVAEEHAAPQALDLAYEKISVEGHAEQSAQYDIITCMEMLEHVPDPKSIVLSIGQLIKPGGWVFLSTINRTAKAYALAIVAAEYVLRLIPKKTHDYDKFIKPSELNKWLREAGLKLEVIKGLHYNPLSKKASLNSDTSVNYLLACRKV